MDDYEYIIDKHCEDIIQQPDNQDIKLKKIKSKINEIKSEINEIKSAINEMRDMMQQIMDTVVYGPTSQLASDAKNEFDKKKNE